jgi:transposase
MAKIKTQVIKGVTYVFERTSYRVPGDPKVHQKRQYLGKFREDGGFVPNKRFLALSAQEQEKTGLHPAEPAPCRPGRPAAPEAYSRVFYGATYLFDQIAGRLQVTDDLKSCFPHQWKQILSIAWYLILEERNPLSRFEKWGKTHKHPYRKSISSPRSSELFAAISEDAIQRFFSSQVKRRLETEYLAYDTTSISTYSQGLEIAKRGKNKEHDHLDQINLSLVFGQESRIPVCYRVLPGNINDVRTVKKLLKDLTTMGMGKIKLVMDRGFYSAENISGLYRNHSKFLIASKCSLKYVRAMIEAHRDTICSVENYLPNQDVYRVSHVIKWHVEGTYPSEGVVHRRMHMHLYYNQEKAVADRRAHHQAILRYQYELEHHQEDKRHAAQYEKYFIVKDYPNRGRKVTIREKVVKSEEKFYGFFILLSNCITDAEEALTIYRSKDCIEKAFGNLKDRLGFRRMRVSDDDHLQGKIFVQYIALIILSAIQKTMKDQDLYRTYTTYSLLDELDVIEYYEQPGSVGHWGETTKKQRDLLAEFGLDLCV